MVRACWGRRVQFAALDDFGRGWGNAGTLGEDSDGKLCGRVDSGHFLSL